VRIFSSDLSKCRKVKFIYGLLLGVSAFVIFIVFPTLWITKAPIPKTSEDYLKEYVYYRLNFTPNTVYDAFYNPLQYKFPLYNDAVKGEIETIRTQEIYQIFKLQRINSHINEDLPRWDVYGKLTKISCLQTCEKLYDGNVKIVISMPEPNRFVIEQGDGD